MLKITTLPSFEKAYKKYAKKYKSLENDLKTIISELNKNPKSGTLLKNNIYKIRLKNSDNNKWKSSWYRIIYYYQYEWEIIFTYMYSKNDLENINEDFINDIIFELSNFI